MAILLLAFTTLFLAVFSLCLIVISRCEQTKEFDAWKQRRHGRAGVDNDVAWHRNRNTIMS
jgi:hypothetical protein